MTPERWQQIREVPSVEPEYRTPDFAQVRKRRVYNIRSLTGTGCAELVAAGFDKKCWTVTRQ